MNPIEAAAIAGRKTLWMRKRHSHQCLKTRQVIVLKGYFLTSATSQRANGKQAVVVLGDDYFVNFCVNFAVIAPTEGCLLFYARPGETDE